MASGTGRQIDIGRLRANLAAAGVELLSAHCATDRVRLQYSAEEIVAFGERRSVERAISSAEAVHRFFAQIEAQINRAEDANQ